MINGKPSIKTNLSCSEQSKPLKHSSYSLPELFWEQIDLLVGAGEFQNHNEFLRAAVREKLGAYFPVGVKESANVSFTSGPPKSSSQPSKKVDNEIKNQICQPCLHEACKYFKPEVKGVGALFEQEAECLTPAIDDEDTLGAGIEHGGAKE